MDMLVLGGRVCWPSDDDFRDFKKVCAYVSISCMDEQAVRATSMMVHQFDGTGVLFAAPSVFNSTYGGHEAIRSSPWLIAVLVCGFRTAAMSVC